MKNCIVLFTTIPEYWDDEKTKPLHSYSGSFLHKNPIYYVTSYKNGRIRTSLNKKDAMHFTDDIECTKCMEQIVAKKNPWTIAVWHYKGNECICECVHYPNEHWKDNNNLQPSLMYRSVTDFKKQLNHTETKFMIRETFEQILKEKNILWNDMVELEVFNPNYVKTFFGKYPKTIKFQGALGYHLGDSNLDLCVDDGPLETKTMYFDFEQVCGIRKIKNK